MNQKESIWNLQTVFIIAVILFWGVPFLQDLLPEQDRAEIIQACLLLVNPCFCLIASIQCAKQSMTTIWYLPLGLTLIFLPLPFLFYELSTIAYAAGYGILSALTISIYHIIQKQHS